MPRIAWTLSTCANSSDRQHRDQRWSVKDLPSSSKHTFIQPSYCFPCRPFSIVFLWLCLLSKPPTYGQVQQQMREESEQREQEERRSKRVCVPMFCGSGGAKGRLAKAAGAEIPEKDVPEKCEKA